MIAAQDLRRVQIRDPRTGHYVMASFGQIEAGDVFRLIEPNGTVVPSTVASGERLASSHARVNCEDITVLARPDTIAGETLHRPLPEELTISEYDVERIARRVLAIMTGSVNVRERSVGLRTARS